MGLVATQNIMDKVHCDWEVKRKKSTGASISFKGHASVTELPHRKDLTSSQTEDLLPHMVNTETFQIQL